MPFRSEAQRRYLWATNPALAKKWAHENPGQHDLPYHVKKTAAITLLTGSAGAGKSTLAQKLAPHYDLVVTTDTGHADPEKGVYVIPSPEEKQRIRAEKTKQILEAHAQGKRVLVEGFPAGHLKFPGVATKADSLLVLGTPTWRALWDVGRRSFQRNTPVFPDLKMAVETRRDDSKRLSDLAALVGAEKIRVIGRDYAEKRAYAPAPRVDLIPGGKADKKDVSDFDPKALREGMKVESEHTSSPIIAREVAMDHLVENPFYYKFLKRMESSKAFQQTKKEAAGALAPLLSREKKKALTQVDTFFGEKDKDKRWDKFGDQTARKSFVQALLKDPRADEKLKLHADRMNRLISGKKIGEVVGLTGTYDIKKLRGEDRLGCTCADWRYKRSIEATPSACKHIKTFRAERKEDA